MRSLGKAKTAVQRNRSKLRLRKNDTVIVVAGKDKGKTGRILEVDRDAGRVVVEGVNMMKKAMRRKSQNDKGGIREVEGSVHISNVRILNKNGQPDRIHYRLEGGKKIRVCAKTGEQV